MSATTKSEQPAHTGHRARLKKRLQIETQALSDYEILEMLLGYALLRKDTKPLAKALLQRFCTLRGVMDARADELQSVDGFGPGLAHFMCLLREFMARYAESAVRQREELVNPRVVAHMARTRMAGMAHEECWVAFVDRQNRLLAWERLQKGRSSEVSIQPRDVLELALERKACGIILVHNHPGGKASPSTPDLLLTQELQRLAPAIGLRFLDHIIVTEASCYSLNEGGLL